MFITTRLNGFGDALPAATVLNHALVPFRGHAVYLRLVSTVSRALDYAAGGFHVSVDRGTAGGCLDPWSIHKGGTAAVPCASPRGNEAARVMWAAAATQYKAAYDALKAGGSVASAKTALATANTLADKAYADESAASVAAGGPPITPPRDPETGAPESGAVRVSRAPKLLMGFGVGIAAFGLAAAIMSKRGKKGRAGAKAAYTTRTSGGKKTAWMRAHGYMGA